ncbi:class A sortase [Floricoccus tropicus]|uniref:Class A sortase n=1 Tax=Floricoccus tropicus TaxID=1859473 RepID=A0A1E8GSA4_9LACT|nr:class A sortase [Floricoccus tropicus]OFI50483.1 class A sortase [Floricoccus tropicus]
MSKEKKKKRSLKNTILNIFIFFLFVIGIALIFNKEIRNLLIGNTTQKYQINNVTKKAIDKNKKANTSFDFDKVKSVSLQDILNSQLDRASVDNLPVIGGIAIPDLNVNLPIFKGVGNVELLYGAGTMKEDQEMGKGNYALASHHISGMVNADKLLFTPLERAQVGMKIYLTDKSKIYEYEIDNTGVFDPTRVDLIEDVPGKTQVTLVTCSDLEATARIIVFGKFIKEYDTNSANETVSKAYKTDFNRVQ